LVIRLVGEEAEDNHNQGHWKYCKAGCKHQGAGDHLAIASQRSFEEIQSSPSRDATTEPNYQSGTDGASR
jgi:hypothetical protein